MSDYIHPLAILVLYTLCCLRVVLWIDKALHQRFIEAAHAKGDA